MPQWIFAFIYKVFEKICLLFNNSFSQKMKRKCQMSNIIYCERGLRLLKFSITNAICVFKKIQLHLKSCRERIVLKTLQNIFDQAFEKKDFKVKYWYVQIVLYRYTIVYSLFCAHFCLKRKNDQKEVKRIPHKNQNYLKYYYRLFDTIVSLDVSESCLASVMKWYCVANLYLFDYFTEFIQ